MKTKLKVFTSTIASLVGLFFVACTADTNGPSKVGVDRNINVAIYATHENGDTIETVLPALMKETVRISELVQYPGDDRMTMPFYLSDTTVYAEITEKNIGKRIAIGINGKIMSTPVVKMRIGNGACSVPLDSIQTHALFPSL